MDFLRQFIYLVSETDNAFSRELFTDNKSSMSTTLPNK